MWKIYLFVIVSTSSSLANRETSSKKFTIDEFLSTTFPYTDPRTDNQLYMDPCKAGKKLISSKFSRSLHLQKLYLIR